jgi:predicted small lipoprotein YifL
MPDYIPRHVTATPGLHMRSMSWNDLGVTRLRLLSVLLTVLALAGCGSSGSTSEAPADEAQQPSPEAVPQPPPPAPSQTVTARPRPDHGHGTGSIELAFKTLDAYGLDPTDEAECLWEHADKRPQSHWRCQVGGKRYLIHITPAGNPVNYVTDGWRVRAKATNSPYTLVATPREPPPAPPAPAASASSGKVCWPDVTIPAVHIPATTIPATTIPATTIPATTIPATTIPATTIGGVHYPAQHYPAQHYPAQHYPAQHYPAVTYPAQTIAGTTIPGDCFDAGTYPAPSQTTVRVSGYNALDRDYSPDLSNRYWRSGGSVPNYTAPGFGELNEAGFPKNQYVRSYFRRDGTFVRGYWRNSPSDGLPTCRIITC